jgi:micrococcal nuclease
MRLRRHHKLSLLSFVIFVLLVVATQSGWIGKSAQTISSNDPGLYAVTKFDDGDTIVVDMNGHAETVRFIGVDTPETHRPNTPVQCYGPEASAFTKSYVGTQRVRLQADPLDTNRDRYGRLLRYVYLADGTLVEDQLLKGGYAFAYTQFPFEKKSKFVAEESSAKAAGKGLWSACKVHDDSGRQQTNDAT